MRLEEHVEQKQQLRWIWLANFDLLLH